LRELCPDLSPDQIVGDFDSIHADVLESYRSAGVTIKDLHEDQDSTDLEKALQAAQGAGCTKFIVAGQHAGVEGRLDHTFGIANTLHSYKDKGPMVVLGNDSFLCLLGAGEHKLFIPIKADAPYCGLIPLAGACEKISTSGLRWNMTEDKMEFGGLISVCNRVEPSSGGHVWVKTSSPVLWTCQLK